VLQSVAENVNLDSAQTKLPTLPTMNNSNNQQQATSETNTVVFDDRLRSRAKLAQRGIAAFGSISVMLYTAANLLKENEIASSLFVSCIVTALFGLFFWAVLYYKNVTLSVIKRLLLEINIVVILLLAACNLFIDFYMPGSPVSGTLSLLYFFITCVAVFMDALKVKGRMFVIAIYTIYVAMNLNNIYGTIFGVADNGVKLATYNIQGKEVYIWKRSTKRSLFIHVLLFSINGVWTVYKDKKMEFMVFATGNIYRNTGTASKHVEDHKFSNSRRQEMT
jgi:hypothetical protein